MKVLVLKVPEERQLLILVKVTFNCVLAAFPPVQLSLSSYAFMIHTIASSFEWGRNGLERPALHREESGRNRPFGMWLRVCACVYMYTLKYSYDINIL